MILKIHKSGKPSREALRFKSFCEEVLVHTKGEWANRPFQLEPWQWKDIVAPLFGTMNPNGTRQYRTAYISLARKNGKSELAAAVALYMLLMDGEQGGEVYGAASDRDQASLVFNVAADMVRRSPALTLRCDLVPSTKRIIDRKTGSIYRAIPADAGGSHGFNASAVIFDEIHTQRSRDLWDVLTTSTGARRQPLVFGISTAGWDRHSLCYELDVYAQKVLTGVIPDPTFFAYIRRADVEDDWRDEKIWKDANPALGKFRSIEEMRNMARRAERVPALQNTFRQLYLNQWTEQDERWIDLAAWDACGTAVEEQELHGRHCYAGLDLASKTDLTALVMLFPSDAGYRVLPIFWIPEERMHERVRRDGVPYDVWVQEGHIRTTPGNVVDYDFVRRDINELGKKYEIREIAIDRWNSAHLQSQLKGDGFEMVQFGQGFASMAAPTSELEKIILAREIRHGGHPVLRWNVSNVAVKKDAAGNMKPDKSRSSEKIDGVVAMIMALGRAMVQPPEESTRSVYESRGMVTL